MNCSAFPISSRGKNARRSQCGKLPRRCRCLLKTGSAPNYEGVACLIAPATVQLFRTKPEPANSRASDADNLVKATSSGVVQRFRRKRAQLRLCMPRRTDAIGLRHGPAPGEDADVSRQLGPAISPAMPASPPPAPRPRRRARGSGRRIRQRACRTLFRDQCGNAAGDPAPECPQWPPAVRL